MFKATGNSYKNAKIGTDNNSETEIPNYFNPKIKNNKKIKLIDCPGFEDTYGIARIVTNAYFNYRVFSKVHKMKFILVVEQSDLTETATGFVKTFESFIGNFKEYGSMRDQIL